MDTAARSRIMAAIRSRDTSCERILRQALWARGVRGWRVRNKIPGRPDVWFPRWKIAVFVDGCFWHKCPTCFRPPRQRLDFWEPKLSRNVARDQEVTRMLQEAGWQVLRFWEHEIRANPDGCAQKVLDSIITLSAGG